MRIAGLRTDGAMYVTLGGGLAVILKGNYVTAPLDQSVIEPMGPWAPSENGWQLRRDVQARLNFARVAPVTRFQLGLSSDETRVVNALRTQFAPRVPDALTIPRNGLGSDWVVFLHQGKYYGVSYDLRAEGVSFDTPVEVPATWEDGAFDLHASVKGTPFYTRFTASTKTAQTIARLLS